MKLNQKAIETLKTLSAEMIASAKIGDTGLALASSTILYSLFKDHYNFYGGENHINRDRFVFSAGTASALYYSLLHMFGFDISGSDLKNYAVADGKTPFIPLLNATDGIEASSGSTGHGVATAVGLAMSQAHLAEKFNVQKFNIINNYTYCFVSESCLMSGIAQEAASLAGTLKLNKLILLYSHTGTTSEGDLDSVNCENIKKKFRAMGFRVLTVLNGQHYPFVWLAIKLAKRSPKPTLIIFKTKVAHGSPLEGSYLSRNKALTHNQIEKMKADFNHNGGSFSISNEVKQYCMRTNRRLKVQYSQWERQVVLYKNTHPELAEQLNGYYEKPNISLFKIFKDKLGSIEINENATEISFSNKQNDVLAEKDEKIKNSTITEKLNKTESKSKTTVESEIASEENLITTEKNGDILLNFNNDILNYIASLRPCISGGNAGFFDSQRVYLKDREFSKNHYRGKNIMFGNRNLAAGSVCNGISLYFGAPCFCAGPLILAGDMLSSMRSGAQMRLPVLYIFTRDNALEKTFGTHQLPAEQLNELRNISDFTVFRPMNKTELLACHSVIYESESACALLLSNQTSQLQNLLNLDSINFFEANETKFIKTDDNKIAEDLFKKAQKGAYILSEDKNADVIIFASGKEIYLALKTKEILNKQNHKVCIVSVPSIEVFEKQSQKYKNSILKNNIKIRAAAEASNDKVWYKFIGADGVLFSSNEIGDDIKKDFNLNAKNFAAQIKKTKS
ncbi:MAG: hypothetical protein PHH71_02490 [Clostridia bacterium]|nr:hypothetical protein [Clostridia bacterium]